MSFAAYWVVSGNLVASTVTTPIYGRLSDIYGLRLVLLTSIRLFVAASVLCVLSQTMLQLIGSRILQGALAVGVASGNRRHHSAARARSLSSAAGCSTIKWALLHIQKKSPIGSAANRV